MTEEINTESVKHRRVVSYFVQAAKEIIVSEGVESATVRNIAAKAGYAVSTLYQYFEDLNKLLIEVKKSFIADLIAEIGKHVISGSQTAADIKTQNRAFMDFFINQPHVYPFFYMNLDPSGENTFDHLVFSEDYYLLYEGFSRQGIINRADIRSVAKIIVYSMNGMLRIYFSNHGISKEDIHADLDQIIEFLLVKE